MVLGEANNLHQNAIVTLQKEDSLHSKGGLFQVTEKNSENMSVNMLIGAAGVVSGPS